MQQMTRRMAHTIARTALCTVLPWAWWGCSPDLALGDVSAQEQPLAGAPEGEPAATASAPAEESALANESEAPRLDFTLAPELLAPEVTMRVDKPGGGEVAVSGVGDLDGDGYADFAIAGAERANDVEFVHIRYGGPRSTDPGSGFVLEQSGARLLLPPLLRNGIEVIQPAGDVDGDGYADLLVGLTRCFPAESSEGVYLLYGGPQRWSGVLPIDDVGVQLRDPREPELSAESACDDELDPHVAALGDFDGDGLDDFVVADQRATGTNTAYLFYGSAQRLTKGASLLDAGARFQVEGALVPTATGDVNADGTADLLLSAFLPDSASYGSYFLPGSRERRSGELQATSAGIRLGELFPFTATGAAFLRPALYPTVLSPPDVDADGAADLLFWSASGDNLLFYGQPGLFAAGADLSRGVLLENDTDLSMDVWFAGDRDGDGDTEIVARFYDDEGLRLSNVAFLSGSRQRAAGKLLFPVQSVRQANPTSELHEPSRMLQGITIAGDLDGDGAGDLLTTSGSYSAEGDAETGYIFTISEPELHIHYGVPGDAPPPVR